MHRVIQQACSILVGGHNVAVLSVDLEFQTKVLFNYYASGKVRYLKWLNGGGSEDELME